ncbi:protein UL79 [Saimiriine betaherpesvirus 4]|uniref:Protein UL79 n=1 Tax=Saimiriine betaherpesvirus 4 TaxID=1535247 RepID=G8XSY4_9BETA|nr:protein UL79 [Saimiriine betaherpesvirus 4]AEV80930.1 protein UL79 [Saimiriine betaherpesvirus 4]
MEPSTETHVRTGRFSFTCTHNLIIQITTKLASGQPLTSFQLEELKIIKLSCLMLFHRGLELLLLRETLNNLGISDNTVLSRKAPLDYWFHLAEELKHIFPELDLNRIFNEHEAAEISRHLTIKPMAADLLLTKFIQRHTQLLLKLPPDLARNGNILFSLGTLYGHRLFRLASFFNRYWGTDSHEPLIRIICQKMWYFYLIATGKMLITPNALEIQRTRHEYGIFNFIIDDYKTFTGTTQLYQEQPLSPSVISDTHQYLSVPEIQFE